MVGNLRTGMMISDADADDAKGGVEAELGNPGREEEEADERMEEAEWEAKEGETSLSVFEPSGSREDFRSFLDCALSFTNDPNDEIFFSFASEWFSASPTLIIVTFPSISFLLTS